MRALTLTKPVTLPGRSLSGLRPAPITFEPYDDPGWHWRRAAIHLVPAERRFRRIVLCGGDATFEVFEHIGALWATGLNAVNILTDSVSPRYPRTTELWNGLKPYTRESDKELVFWHPTSNYRSFCGGDRNRYIQIEPSSEKKLRIRVEVDYPDIGRHVEEYCFPDLDLLERVFSAYTLGRAPLEFLVRQFTVLPIVRDAMWAGTWRTAEERLELLRKICDHRALDILGALSLAAPHGDYFSMRVNSVRGGHECDMDAVMWLRREYELEKLA